MNVQIGNWFIARVTRRRPDFIIGGADAPYLRRWWTIPRNRFLNAYLHHFLRSDDDRARHTHPWLWKLSILLRGRYREWYSDGPHDFVDREAGTIKFRWGAAAHRIELIDGPCWTLFLTGPRVREWGFLCPSRFVHWREFTAPTDAGEIGSGCGE
ncbi:hypothetical protein LFL96_21075 [Paraburkholderia sp. D15]|uniref:hypothetical protein n=1 Tax=Paraburkholderia sp. D15 TaxID=2880218 RepID=UPI00247952E2|nr:hypothetical protein [Paraburkholderia sp. D15]WGS53554.1 hypothetical protein LFL96_21075 [Paraburkholderia sp. D15]